MIQCKALFHYLELFTRSRV